MSKKPETLPENPEDKEIELDDLKQVTGCGAFGNVPRVPEKKINDSLRGII